MHECYLGLHADKMDEESRLRYRAEIRQVVAEITVKKTRLQELQAVIAAVNADSDTAAEEHSAACGPLQDELKSLDEQHVAAILAKKPLPKNLTDRRVAILQRIADENTRLELRVAANRKTAEATQREWNALRSETAVAGALENSLLNLAPKETRLERQLIDLQTRACDMVSDEIERLRKVAEHNVHICRDLNKEPHKAAPYLSKISDYGWLSMKNGELKMQLLKRDRELHQQALSE